jgi:hypothetical protein
MSAQSSQTPHVITQLLHTFFLQQSSQVIIHFVQNVRSHSTHSYILSTIKNNKHLSQYVILSSSNSMLQLSQI